MSREDREELHQAMREQDFTEGEVLGRAEQRSVSVVFSFRAPEEWDDEIVAETRRRGLNNPSQLVRALVREGLDRAAAGDDRVVHVRVGDLHRAIDSIVTRAA